MKPPNAANPGACAPLSAPPLPATAPPFVAEAVGASPPRVDARDKVTGRTLYVDDLGAARMLHAAIRASDHPHADIAAIRTERARALDGVEAVVTAAEIPGANQVGLIVKDQPLLVESRARWLGDRIALVAARTPELARQAARLVDIESHPLPGVFSPEDALAPDAPRLHETGNVLDRMFVRQGDPERGFAESEVVVEQTYRVNYQEHAYLEPQGCLAVPGPGGSLTIHASCQCPFYVQKAVATVLGIEANRVRVIQTPTGGAFGGKEDYPSEPAACAALLAWKTGRPVKFVYGREEDIAWSSKRHRMTMHYRLGARRDGRLVAARLRLLVDTGAYAGLTTVVAERSNISSIGPYRLPHVDVETVCVYTNNLFGGAFRGFGAPQVAFAHESAMDEVAERLGMDPVALRRRNAYRPGDRMASGQPLEGAVPCIETLDAATRAADWERRRAAHDAHNAAVPPPRHRRGLGVSSIVYGVNLHAGGQRLNRSGAHLQVHGDGSVSIAIGLTEMGQGLLTAACQMAADALGVRLDRVFCHPIDTALVPDSGPTVASRATVMSGFPLLDAAAKIRRTVAARVAPVLGCPPESVVVRGDRVFDAAKPDGGMTWPEAVGMCVAARDNLVEVGWYRTPEQPWDKPTGQGIAYNAYAYATQVADVEIDTLTGEIAVRDVWCAHDVGRAIHPNMVEGQIEGGVVQGMGWAIMENLVLRDGRPLNPDFTDYLIPTSVDVPRIHSILIESDPTAHGPYGIKGIGEPSLIPTAGALANAIAQATGLRFRELPITPERVVLALRNRSPE